MSQTSTDELDVTLQCFLDWAQAQGWRYDKAKARVGHFLRFLRHRGVERFDAVDSALLLRYERTLRASLSPATVNGYLGYLRALWRYLIREELVEQDVTQAVPQLRRDDFQPHLYSAAELDCLERAARAEIGHARAPARRSCRQAKHAAFALLRDCGLRVSEACRLDVSDFDAQARTIRIAQTKFFKTRVIPLPRSTSLLLEQYLAHRQQRLAETGEVTPGFFLLSSRQRLRPISLEVSWKRLLEAQGLYQPRRRQGRTVLGSTNLHGLRHSFAVRTLERWQGDGLEVERLLPLLSSYLGHAKVCYTAVYLHLTPRLRRLASERFARLVLPGLDHGETIEPEDDLEQP